MARRNQTMELYPQRYCANRPKIRLLHAKNNRPILKQYRNIRLHSMPNNLDYSLIGGLSAEVTEKLIQYRLENLSQMLKISGITPAAATILDALFEESRKTNSKTEIWLLESGPVLEICFEARKTMFPL